MHVVAVVEADEVSVAMQMERISAVGKPVDSNISTEPRQLLLASGSDTETSTPAECRTSIDSDKEIDDLPMSKSTAPRSAKKHSLSASNTTQRFVHGVS